MNNKNVFKFALSLFGSAVGALFVTFFFMLMLISAISSKPGLFFVSLFACLIYVSFIYSTAWREGNRDPNRVKYGHMEKFMAKGLAAGLIAAIPFAIIYLLLIVTYTAHWHYAVFQFVFAVANNPFSQLLHWELPPYWLCVFLLPLPLAAMAGYIAGYRQIYLLSKIIYKRKGKSKGKA